MSIIPQSVIKKIAEEIFAGNTCYINRFTAKVITIDPATEDAEMIATQEKAIIEVERKKENFVKIEKLSTADKLTIMRDFLDELPDRSVRKQLSNALNRKNPYRNFTMAVESDIELNQHWKNFNAKEYQKWVSNVIIDAYNY